LVAFEGYFVNNRGSSPTTIAIPPKVAAGGNIVKAATTVLAQRIFSGSEWALQITASCDRYLDKDNYLGSLNNASDEWDANDFSEAPFFDQHVALYFPHSAWAIFPGLYTGDFRALKPEGEAWDFVVKSEVKSDHGARPEVKLKLADVKNLPVEWKVVLLDKAGQLAIDFRARGEYAFFAGTNETKRDFRIVVGPPDFVQDHDLSLTAVPDDFVLEPNFPNPFPTTVAFGNPETAIRFGLPEKSVVTLKIFDVAGHEIATLLERVELPAGRHQRLWDGRDAQGRAVTSGIYFCQLAAGNFSRTMKMTLMR
jgi:hypothetical protein